MAAVTTVRKATARTITTSTRARPAGLARDDVSVADGGDGLRGPPGRGRWWEIRFGSMSRIATPLASVSSSVTP